MSGVVRFISDLHFGHRNMATSRGFKDEKEQDALIIKNWNSVVKKRDTTWIMGDLTMERRDYSFLDELNGFKKVVLGNHDLPQHVPDMLNHVNHVCGCFNYKNGVFLTHVPIAASELLYYRSQVNIHGHIHERVLPSKNHINVCAEQIDYTPRTLEYLLEKNRVTLKKKYRI